MWEGNKLSNVHMYSIRCYRDSCLALYCLIEIRPTTTELPP